MRISLGNSSSLVLSALCPLATEFETELKRKRENIVQGLRFKIPLKLRLEISPGPQAAITEALYLEAFY